MVALRAHLTHQDPNAHYRRWEIAGGAHAETPRWVVEVPPALDMGQGCKEPINSAPHHAIVKSGLHALTRWVRDGMTPPESPAIEIGDPAAADPIVRDAFGNAKGGIRLPEVEAPTATLDGRRNDVANAAPGAPEFLFPVRPHRRLRRADVDSRCIQRIRPSSISSQRRSMPSRRLAIC